MFLICGSGRSGTSAVARLLHEAGLSVGHDLIEPDEHNAEGYYEERQLVLINDAILNAAGLGSWFSVASREQVLAASEEYAEYMRALVEEATPAWKDPRLSYTLEAWLPLLPEPPRMIVCLRSASEVVASTMRYYAQAGDEAEAAIKHVWRSEYERLLEIIDGYGLDAMSIEYSRLHADPASAIEPLSQFVGRELDPSLVRCDLRHHSMELPEELQTLYARVLALGR